MTTLKITKQQLSALFAKRVQVNSDNGNVFVGVMGRQHKDGLWHVVAKERPLSDGEILPAFSLKGVLGATPRASSPPPPVADAVVASPPNSSKPLPASPPPKSESPATTKPKQ
jgi:hypothetical protein